jgi:hypothetical protein
MPINTNTGKIKITNHHKYIELHRMKELILLNKKSAQSKKHGNATTASNHINTIIDDGKEQDQDQDQDQTKQQQQELFAGIECPKHNDILFGRGWVIVNHRKFSVVSFSFLFLPLSLSVNTFCFCGSLACLFLFVFPHR